MIRFPVLFVAFAVIGCSSAPSELVDTTLPKDFLFGPLSASSTSEGIQVFNSSDVPDPVYLFAIERETSTYTDWIPCTGGPTCPSVLPGEWRTIPWTTVAGYAPSKREYILSAWRVARAPDGTLTVIDMQHVAFRR